MFLVKLAFKNLTRHRKRTLITAAIIASAIFVFLLIDSLLLGLNNAAYDNIINYSTGDLQIVQEKYWEVRDDLPLKNLLKENHDIVNKIKENNNVKGISEKLVFKARLNNGIDELPVQGIGIRGENISKTLKLKNSIVEGNFFTNGEKKVVLGKRLAELMDLSVGKYLTLLVRTKEDTFNTIELEVGGLLESPNPDINKSNIYIPLKTVQDSLNLNDEISHFLVKINNSSNAGEIANEVEKEIKKIDKGLRVIPWNELTAVSVMTSKQGANQAILGIILLLAAIGIINTVILSALERMEEIGMMKAMGLKKLEIVFTFVLESTGLGIIGGVIGCLTGIIGIFLLNTFGIDFAALYSIDMGNFGIPIIDKIYGSWNLTSFIFVFIFSIVIAMISSILPAYWAAKKDPVDAIHHR